MHLRGLAHVVVHGEVLRRFEHVLLCLVCVAERFMIQAKIEMGVALLIAPFFFA